MSVLRMTEKEAEAFFSKIGKPMPANAHVVGVAAVKKELDALISLIVRMQGSK